MKKISNFSRENVLLRTCTGPEQILLNEKVTDELKIRFAIFLYDSFNVRHPPDNGLVISSNDAISNEN